MPGYSTVLKKILTGISPFWLRQVVSKLRNVLFPIKKIELSIERIGGSQGELLLKAKAQGYRRPQFRFWAKQEERFILIRDWGVGRTCVIEGSERQMPEYGLHVRSGTRGDLLDQVWVKTIEVTS
jgi:hypothetical protein